MRCVMHEFLFWVVDESSPLLYVDLMKMGVVDEKPWTKCIDLMKMGVIDDYITCMCCFGSHLYDWDEEK